MLKSGAPVVIRSGKRGRPKSGTILCRSDARCKSRKGKWAVKLADGNCVHLFGDQMTSAKDDAFSLRSTYGRMPRFAIIMF